MGPVAKCRAGFGALALLLLAPVSYAGSGVANTRHNLSAGGPGQVRSAVESEVCVFCHSAHVESAEGPLWNRATDGSVGYRPYESGTMTNRPGQPDGSTRMCLSCHDGTVALGAVGNRDLPIAMRGGAGPLTPASSGFLGTDLEGTHPVSFEYAQSRTRGSLSGSRTQLNATPDPVDGRALLDEGGRVQCTTCHDPHDDPAALGAPVPPFWRGESVDEVCTACHLAPVNDRGHGRADLLPEGCGSCHVGHGVERQPLLAKAEEGACYECHGSADTLDAARRDGRVSRQARPEDVEAAFARPYRHPIDETSRVHDAGEDLEGGTVVQRHVECADCHPVHGDAAPSPGNRLRAEGAWANVSISGRPQHELCYDCHGSGSGKPYGSTDKSAELNPSNESFHPVEGPLGRRPVPSLLPTWAPGDVMTCDDCHGSDDPDDPKGPHGSRNRWILKDRYEAKDGKPESATTYAACYRCHSRESILSNESFEGHALHVSQAQESCYACHDSHGVADAPSLVRFGKDFRYSQVLPSSSGRLEYDAARGACYLTCHGVDHDPLGYP